MAHVCRLHNKTLRPPAFTDTPEICQLGPDYWHRYPIRDYSYEFNSWGFRGDDYRRFQGELVNVCIGDSNTINLGGPIEHSWPYLLGEKFDIPTLNFGINQACFYEFQSMVTHARMNFKINKVFVLYNLYDNDQEPLPGSTAVSLPNNSKSQTKIDLLKTHCWLHGAHWQFDPPWTFFRDDLECLYQHFPDAHDYLKTVKLDHQDIDIELLLSIDTLRSKYLELAGASWIPYEKFCELFLLGANIVQFFDSDLDKRLVQEFVLGHLRPAMVKMTLTNRDGWHMSRRVNQALADYFYQQTLMGR